MNHSPVSASVVTQSKHSAAVAAIASGEIDPYNPESVLRFYTKHMTKEQAATFLGSVIARIGRDVNQ